MSALKRELEGGPEDQMGLEAELDAFKQTHESAECERTEKYVGRIEALARRAVPNKWKREREIRDGQEGCC